MVYPNDQNPKNLAFFLTSYIRPQCSLREKSRASGPGPGGWGYSWGGQIKTNFSLFCVCVCVWRAGLEIDAMLLCETGAASL